MKKLLFLGAMALLLVACEQKETKEQTPKQEVVIPQNAPSLPMPAIPIQTNGGVDPTAMGNPNGPVLKLEEGKPLDFSQLQTGSVSVAEHVASQIDSIRIKAEQGNATYQYAYGVCYEKGWGVDQDLKQAFAWYNKAAEQKNGPALNSLGNFYRLGSGVNADPKKAFEWYQKGADEKDAQAMLNLGNCYYYGMGTDLYSNLNTVCLKVFINCQNDGSNVCTTIFVVIIRTRDESDAHTAYQCGHEQ